MERESEREREREKKESDSVRERESSQPGRQLPMGRGAYAMLGQSTWEPTLSGGPPFAPPPVLVFRACTNNADHEYLVEQPLRSSESSRDGVKVEVKERRSG